MSAPAEDGLPKPRRTLAFLTILLATLVAVLDGSFVNVILPVLAEEQHVSASDVVWVVSSYQIAVVASLLPLSRLGEAIGFRKVYLVGMALFVVASLACAWAPSLPVLVAARALQGLAGGALMSVNGALLRFTMPQRMLGRGIATMALVVAISSAAAGPTIASAILAVSTWHWLFLINVPIGAVVIWAGLANLPVTPARGDRFDFVSALLNAVTLGLFITGLGNIGGNVPPVLIAAQLVVAAIAGYFLVRRQIARTAPMLPLDLLTLPAFRGSVMASICAFSAHMAALVSLPFFFHDVLGHSAVETGLLLTPLALATALIAPISGRLSDTISPNVLGLAGMLICGAGMVSVTFIQAGSPEWDIAWRLGLIGLGFGLFQSPNNRVMFTSAPRDRSGAASGMQSTARLLGQSIGAALAAIVLGFSSQILPIMAIATALTIASGLLCLTRRQVSSFAT